MTRKIEEVDSIRDQVAGIIRSMIVNEELKEGEQISERQISRMLDVSTTPVKEALRMLQAEGLIYTISRKGSFVSEFSKKNILHRIYMRSALEGVAAHFACQNISNQEIVEMEEALLKSETMLEDRANIMNVITDIEESNDCFHNILRNASNDQYLIGLISNLRSIDRTIRNISLRTEVDEPLRAHKEHMAILEAVKVRDGAKAEEALSYHIRRVGEYTIKRQWAIEKANN